MRIHEFQAKALFAEFGIPVPQGRVAATSAEVAAATQELGGQVALKAQILAGGRGKAGGIRLVHSQEEAQAVASKLLGQRLVTPQTSPEGVLVQRLLVEEAVDIGRELYLGLVIDSSLAMPVMMASPAGGMDIETVAAATPERIFRVAIDPVAGLRSYQARYLSLGLGLEGDLARSAATFMSNLYELFRAKDCSLAEINPLVVTAEGRLLALDAKLNFDDNALFRHPELVALRPPKADSEDDPLEVQAQEWGINNYIHLGGNIGCIVNGAGLSMATMDIIKAVGGEPANFLDTGGSNDPARVVNAFRILAADPRVKAVLVHIFGGITRTDLVAQGVVQAQRELGFDRPIVVRLAGAWAQEARAVIETAALKNITIADDLADAARKAVGAAKGAGP